MEVDETGVAQVFGRLGSGFGQVRKFVRDLAVFPEEIAAVDDILTNQRE